MSILFVYFSKSMLKTRLVVASVAVLIVLHYRKEKLLTRRKADLDAGKMHLKSQEDIRKKKEDVKERE